MKRKRLWTVRSQVALIFTIIALLIASNLYFISQSNRIGRLNEALSFLARENRVLVQEVGFYATTIAAGRNDFSESLENSSILIDQHLDLLEDGGPYVFEGNEITLPPLPRQFKEGFDELRTFWVGFSSNVEEISKLRATKDSTLSFYAADYIQNDQNEREVRVYQKTVTMPVPNKALNQPISSVITDVGQIENKSEEIQGSLSDHYSTIQGRYEIATVVFTLLSIVGLFVGFYVLLNGLFDPLRAVQRTSEKVAEGDLDCSLEEKGFGEIGTLAKTLNSLIDRLKKATEFANQIGQGEFNSEFHVSSEEDKLGYALLEMRTNLKNIAEEDRKRNWSNEGMAKFGDILRSNYESSEDLAYAIISNLVKYLDVVQGGIFTLEENSRGESILVLQSSYAYNRKKFLKRELEIGEGLVGQAVQENSVIYLTDVPKDYSLIQSGMGGGAPKSVLIVPLVLNEEIYGAMELASFEEIEEYQIEFLKKLSESISSTMATSRTNARTRMLLEESQQLTEEMRSQEEEMRQNMEELQATQEEMDRKQVEMEENEKRFREMTENVPGMIFQLEQDDAGVAKFLFVSAGSQSLLGVHSEEVMQAPDHEDVLRVVSEDRESYRKALRTSIERMQPLEWEGRIQVATSGSKWITISAKTEKTYEGNILWNGLIMDVTDKKRSEEQMRIIIKQLEAKEAQVSENVGALQETKDQLEYVNQELVAVMDSIENSVMLLEMDAKLKVTKVNAKFNEFMGYEDAEVLSKELSMLFPEEMVDSAHFRQVKDNLLMGSHLEVLTLWVKEDGEQIWVHGLFFPTHTSEGDVQKIAAIITPLADGLKPKAPTIIENEV